MKGKLLILILCYTFLSQLLAAQDIPKKEIDAARLTDEIFSAQDLDIDYQDLYENYLQLLANPLELNSVTEEQLRTLYILSPLQLNNFLSYRKEYGPFLSVYELQSIPNFDNETIDKLLPFVVVEDAGAYLNKTFLQRVMQERNRYLITRWGRIQQPQKGYLSTTDSAGRYAGTPNNFYVRFRVSRPGDFSFGFTAKNDGGEKIVWAPSSKYYVVDFTSFHLQVLKKQKISNLIVGDYQAQFGQGIALGSAFGIGKSAEAVTTIRRSNLGFSPYTSLYESGYFRGAAMSYNLVKNITLHAMASSRPRDGSIRQDTLLSANDYISSINYTGLHRTPSELTNRNAIQETNLATVVQYTYRTLDVGLISHHTQFNMPLLHTPSLYNQFYFNGKENTNMGGYANFNYSNIALFGEFAQTMGHGRAGVAGMLASVTPQLDVSLLYRYYARNFYSFYSNALAENSAPQNETGIYWGWKYIINKTYSLAGYTDLFHFPWLRYRGYSPSDGSEWFLRFNYKPSKTTAIFLQAREESKMRNTGIVQNLYATSQGIKRSYCANAEYGADQHIRLRTRMQFSTYTISEKTTHGMAVMQDLSIDWKRLNIAGRYALFDTDDYDNRIYAYERDTYLAFSFPPYYGKGARSYFLLSYSLTPKIDLSLRYAHTQYINQQSIGSGGDTIQGNTRNDVKFQARIRL